MLICVIIIIDFSTIFFREKSKIKTDLVSFEPDSSSRLRALEMRSKARRWCCFNLLTWNNNINNINNNNHNNHNNRLRALEMRSKARRWCCFNFLTWNNNINNNTNINNNNNTNKNSNNSIKNNNNRLRALEMRSKACRWCCFNVLTWNNNINNNTNNNRAIDMRSESLLQLLNLKQQQ